MKEIIRLIHRGTGGEQGWIYSVEGILSTIPASTYKDPPKIVVVQKDDCNEKQEDNRIRLHRKGIG